MHRRKAEFPEDYEFGSDETILLSKAIEKGEITPNQYAKLRQSVIGKPNLFHNLILPLFSLKRYFSPRTESISDDDC
jgi:hypothetical protein